MQVQILGLECYKLLGSGAHNDMHGRESIVMSIAADHRDCTTNLFFFPTSRCEAHYHVWHSASSGRAPQGGWDTCIAMAMDSVAITK